MIDKQTIVQERRFYIEGLKKLGVIVIEPELNK